MSADLFAAFSETETPQQSNVLAEPLQHDTQDGGSITRGSVWHDQAAGQASSHVQSSADDAGEDDEWGAFETSPQLESAAAFAPPVAAPQSKNTSGDDYGFASSYVSPPPNTAGTRLNVDPTNGKDDEYADWGRFDSFDTRTHETNVRPTNVHREKRQSDPNVLFDAEDEIAHGQDDDFGDFEGPGEETHDSVQTGIQTHGLTVSSPPAVTMPSLDLLGLDDAPTPMRLAGGSPYFLGNASKNMGSLLDEKGHQAAPKPPAAKEVNHDEEADEDDWGDFSDQPTPEPAAPVIVQPPTTSGLVTEETCPRPTNIPPPSILLTLFPPLLTTPLLKDVWSNISALKAQVQKSPSETITPLQGHISDLTVLAYILAGRSLRWKRDTFLSQALRIGPAASSTGRSGGGMKLTQISRGETAQENREAAEVVELHQQYLGKIRAAVGAVNAIRPKSLHAVPDVFAAATSKSVVRIASLAEGAVKEKEPQCALCGLKRDERIRGVDDAGDAKVEDSFGEWWVKHWGHRACRQFWHENEEFLAQR